MEHRSRKSTIVDRTGAIASLEVVAVVTLAAIGMIVAMASVRDSVVSEISDIGDSIQDANQTFAFNGMFGHSGSTSGSDYGDTTDHCDTPEDIAGAADNCIVFDVPPSDELGPIPDGSVTVFDFESGAGDGSGSGNNGIPRGDATIEDGTLTVDGNGIVIIPNSDDINLGIHDQRTISLDFKAEDVTTRQVLYEEGATVRGLVIYIDDGNLYIGGWNRPADESGWTPTFISTPITAGQPINATLRLDGTTSVQPGALTGFINGSEFGSAPGSQLWQHGGGIGLGATNGTTVFHDGNSTGLHGFAGMIDDVYIYNDALSDSDINNIAGQ